jgi:hypothetical protein
MKTRMHTKPSIATTSGQAIGSAVTCVGSFFSSINPPPRRMELPYEMHFS